ncbi:MAG: T9SS type A sorting domain-containing protein [Parafilimonas sp.]|nr:T9SS type A sorting domain-containing protein [Parafilimonas sp.]
MHTKSFFKKVFFTVIVIVLFVECSNAQWKKTSGPPGMSVNVFYQRGSTLFAGTSPNGVFKSVNNGVSWIAVNNGIADKNVFALTASTKFLFAGTDSGVFRSPDNGITWQAANQDIEQKFIYSFLFANGFLFAGTSAGLYKSSDEGLTWTDANGFALNSSIIHDIAYAPPHLVVIADNLVFYSDDNGNSWNYNSNSPFVLGVNPSFLARHDSLLLASGPSVFRSFDGGINWSNAITAANNNIDGLVQANSVIIAGTRSGMSFSSNFGKTWKPIKQRGMRNGNWFTHDFYRSGNNFLLAYDEIGVGYSGDSGRNWNYTIQGFPPAASIDNAINFSNNILLSGTHGDGIYKSANAGNSWIKVGTTNNGDTLSNSNIFALLKINNVILAGTCGNGLYRSADNGISWTHITSGLPNQQGTGFLCVHQFAKTSNAVLAGTDQGLFFSSDSGLTWNATSLNKKDVAGVAANDSVACAAIENFTGPSAIYRSINNPAAWGIVFQTTGDDWTTMSSDGKTHFYAGTLSTSNLVSNNNGLSWQTVGAGIPDGSGGFAIGVLNNNVFVGNSSGIFFSNNNGLSFTQANAGFDKNHSASGFAISSTDVYAGLFENSIWKRPLSDFGITSLQNTNEEKLPVTFLPNPLTSESKLTYSIASTQHVSINLYNSNGNLVKCIKDRVQDKGVYSTIISKANLHTGNYYISIVAGDKHAVVNVMVEGN